MNLPNLTMGEFLTLLNTELYPNPQNDFEKDCLERENGIKNALDICGRLLNEHLQYIRSDEYVSNHWRDARFQKNLDNIQKYTALLIPELTKERIEAHCKTKKESLGFLFFQPFMLDTTFLMVNRIHSTLITDIFWTAEHLPYIDVMEIVTGQKGISILGKHLPDAHTFAKNDILPYVHDHSRYGRHHSVIEEALVASDNNLFFSSNMLIMSTIEGLIRDLAMVLNSAQEHNHDFNHRKFNSLDSLLRNGDWKDDYRISKRNLRMLTGDFEPYVSNSSDPKVEHEDEHNTYEFISLKTRLDFLRRRFKDDRNDIFHGQNSKFGTDYYLFINLSALKQLYYVLIYYDKLYPIVEE
ncbi:hypothetical protein D3C87_24370 [compost metagenome]